MSTFREYVLEQEVLGYELENFGAGAEEMEMMNELDYQETERSIFNQISRGGRIHVVNAW